MKIIEDSKLWPACRRRQKKGDENCPPEGTRSAMRHKHEANANDQAEQKRKEAPTPIGKAKRDLTPSRRVDSSSCDRRLAGKGKILKNHRKA